MIGNVLDKYEILQKVGEGGMATVYRGRHTTLGRDVAIKILHPHLSASERNRMRFAREARAIENLDHDNILKIFDYSGDETEDCYIVTEFVDGATLQALISEHGRLPSEVATLVGLKLSAAMGYAHELGIIHRDLKPENVMVRRDGAVKLMDFGIARFLDEMNLTLTGALVGSPAYMSPEQSMERVLDPRSDLFSLGTLLFHLVTGQLPFSGNHPGIILKNIIEGNRPEVMELAPDISASFADLIERLLQTEADDRPLDARAVQAELQRSLTEVDLDHTSPEWNLRAWLVDPKGYQERLTARLRVALLADGKSLLAQDDHLGALRRFNRLLSLDEDNPEVLELVQDMHAAGMRDESGRRPWWLAGVAVAALACLFAWAAWPEPRATEPDLSESPTGSDSLLAQPVESPPERPPEPETPPTAAEVVAPTPPTPQPLNPQADTVRLRRPPVDDRPGLITVEVPLSWAHVYVDGDLKGRTGRIGELKLTPGEHTLSMENPYTLPWEVTFTIGPGEEKHFVVPLLDQPKPSVLAFDPRIADGCILQLDGDRKGTVGSVNRRLNISTPDQAHELGIACPERSPYTVSLNPSRPGSVIPVGAP